MSFQLVKKYSRELGLSSVFRQWRAESHCKYLHGYSLAFTFTFACDTLDKHDWVVDLGALKPFKEMLINRFDHKLCVASDDPDLDMFTMLEKQNLVQLSIFPDGVGVEKFAQFVHTEATHLLQKYFRQDVLDRKLRIASIECAEHDANSATYIWDE